MASILSNSGKKFGKDFVVVVEDEEEEEEEGGGRRRRKKEEEEEESVAEIVPTSTSIPKTVVKRTKRSVKTLPVDAIPPLPKWKKEDNYLNVLLKEMGFN